MGPHLSIPGPGKKKNLPSHTKLHVQTEITPVQTGMADTYPLSEVAPEEEAGTARDALAVAILSALRETSCFPASVVKVSRCPRICLCVVKCKNLPLSLHRWGKTVGL